MKRIAYSFLLIFLLSCGSHTPSSHNRITLQLRDSVIHDYFLLSVRDSSFIVSPYTNRSITNDGLIGSAEVVPIQKIEKIIIKGDHSPLILLLPGMAGCIGGWGATQNGASFFSVGGVGPPASKAQPYASLGGFLIGASIGYFEAYRDKELAPRKADDLKNLQNFYALFPNTEPLDLQKIK